MTVTLDDAHRVGDALRVNWDVVSPEVFRYALGVELEHTDVTHGDLYTTGRIAIAHLREFPDYYTRLAPMEQAAEQYWSIRKKPSPTFGGTMNERTMIIALIVVVVIMIVFVVCWRWRRALMREKLSFPPFVDALGYETPVPGDPERNILRRSRPYPPGRYPEGGLNDFYFSYDPSYSTSYENDYCHHAPVACAGFALEPFRPTL